MGAVVIFSIGLLFLFSVPIITSKLAVRLGRSGKKWFLIGLALPVVATIILFFLPDKSKE